MPRASSPELEPETVTSADRDLLQVVEALRRQKGFAEKVGQLIRSAFDGVIDGAMTGRWLVEQLEKTEKTYLGTKVEIYFRNVFEIPRGEKLDLLIADHEVDVKFTVSRSWMIPVEAVGKLCVLIEASDDSGLFSVGVIRAAASHLTPGHNRDRKRSISASGRRNITWLVQNALLPTSPLQFMREMPSEITRRIAQIPSGQERILHLLRSYTRRVIPREVIAAVAVQKDPMKRVRDARKMLKQEGIVVLVGRQTKDIAMAHHFGFEIRNSSVVSIPITRNV